MTTVTGLFLFSSAIAGFGLGWLLRSQSPARQQSPASIPQDVTVQGSHHPTHPQQPQNPPLHRPFSLLQKAPIGYLEVDDENQLLWINDLACQMLGLSDEVRVPETQAPRLLIELVRSFELDELIENTRQAQASCQQDWTLNLVSPDPINPNEGTAYPLRGYGVALEDNRVGIFLENRQEAQTLVQQRDRWTSDVAHELKTPLTSIRLVAETLRDRIEPDAKKWIDRLLNEILRLSNLVEDLLNLTRLERSGGTGLSLKPVELPQLVLAAWQSLEPLAEVKHIQIAYQGPTDLIVLLDETLMYRVFINLMDNAIKYSPRESTVYVNARLESETASEPTAQPILRLVVDIIDEGSGFQESDLPYIFNRFYRADPSRTRLFDGTHTLTGQSEQLADRGRSNGTGLGLAITQQIVEAHGGRIEARNHPETGGGWLTIAIATKPLSLEEAAINTDMPSKLRR
jgi:two-component system phosphate regulon sensor histidine kinase PhoR